MAKLGIFAFPPCKITYSGKQTGDFRFSTLQNHLFRKTANY